MPAVVLQGLGSHQIDDLERAAVGDYVSAITENHRPKLVSSTWGPLTPLGRRVLALARRVNNTGLRYLGVVGSPLVGDSDGGVVWVGPRDNGPIITYFEAVDGSVWVYEFPADATLFLDEEALHTIEYNLGVPVEESRARLETGDPFQAALVLVDFGNSVGFDELDTQPEHLERQQALRRWGPRVQAARRAERDTTLSSNPGRTVISLEEALQLPIGSILVFSHAPGRWEGSVIVSAPQRGSPNLSDAQCASRNPDFYSMPLGDWMEARGNQIFLLHTGSGLLPSESTMRRAVQRFMQGV